MHFKKSMLAIAVPTALFVLSGCSDDGDSDNNNDSATTQTTPFNGSLRNVDFHPLQAEITAGTITPAAAHACPAGTSAGQSTFVTIFDKSFPVCLLNGHLTGNTTYALTNDHVYVLTDYIKVGNGGIQDNATPDATILNIEAGTQIFAHSGQKAGIRVTRGADINVNGTAAMPVTMSAVEFDLSGGSITGDATDFSGRGEWGGLVVDGYAVCSSDDAAGAVIGELASEAAPATETDVYFCGQDDTDSSGSITYLVIAESGVAFQPDAELQGLTLEGVGSGTTISHVQVLGSEDDGIEWFGGSVNVDHIVINAQDDDGLDFDDGYIGNVEYAIVRMGDNDGDTGIEADSLGVAGGRDSSPNLAYVTILGNVGKSSKSTLGAMFKKSFAGKTYRSAFVDDANAASGASAFDGACFDVDDTLNASLALVDVVCASAAGEVVSDSDTEQDTFKAGNNYDVSTATVTVDATNLGVSGYTPAGTVPAGIADNAYVGAVDPATATPWWDGWTVHIAHQ